MLKGFRRIAVLLIDSANPRQLLFCRVLTGEGPPAATEAFEIFLFNWLSLINNNADANIQRVSNVRRGC